MIAIDTAERRRRLQVRHLLTAATRSPDVAAVADAIVALHATDPATVYLSAWARMTAGSQTEIADAIYGRKHLVRMMAMRRTMFVTATDLAPVLQASSALGVAATQCKRLLTELRQAEISDDVERWLDEVSESAVAALTRRGRAVATDLVADEPRLNAILDLAPDKAYAAPQKVTSRVLTILALQGRIIRGAPVGGWTSNRNEWWPATAWMPGGLGDLDPAEARVTLAQQWLARFGPAPLADLVWWTGWTVGQTRTALKDINTVEVDLDGTPGIALADDLDPTAEPEPTAALLPALDPTPMGWVERGWYLGEHRERLFDRTGNIGPTIFWQGRVVGGWAQRRNGEIRLELLEDIGASGVNAVEQRAADLTDWLGALRFIPRFRTPLERELTA
ncbi:hypothetical protein ABIB25_004326 [Nakamurella sp. UYEF19]|uniref:winged helix DNA-binding domain-containing protein n=1 Tax=Nakamurella sp. UYEF19 TaxID=1756392 RepID=UPI003390BCE1